jgi:hypothetical protein
MSLRWGQWDLYGDSRKGEKEDDDYCQSENGNSSQGETNDSSQGENDDECWCPTHTFQAV